MINLIGYVGSILMVVFSFTFRPEIAIIGLTCLTVQSVKMKAHNLTALNIISICGMVSQLF